MQLFIVGAIVSVGVSAQQDCSGAGPWAAKVYSNPHSAVHYDGRLYHNLWYATAADIPGAGEHGPWILDGPCASGSGGASGNSSASTVDCSTAIPWKAAVYATPHTMVHHGNALYKNTYWVDQDTTPGVHEAWTLVGSCKEGTVGSGPGNAYPEVDCSQFGRWSGAFEYAATSVNVHWEGLAYKNVYWTQADLPGLTNADGSPSPWEVQGKCKEGTDTMETEDPNPMTDEKRSYLCSCCSGCARSVGTEPKCMNDVTTKETCYFTWCPDHSKSTLSCDDIKKKQMLNYYSGELVSGKPTWPSRVYVPYIDGGLAVQPILSDLARDLNIKHFVIAFVTAGVGLVTEGCEGAFAGVIPVRVGPFWTGEGGVQKFVYEEVNKLRKMGGDITISFGGANGIELADSPLCQSTPNPVESIKKAYQAVIDAAKLTHIDFDIEGNAIGEVHRQTGWQLRFQAVKALVAENPGLKVWWTLPILPIGLTPVGEYFIHDMMASGVQWDRFNVMTMDYGDDTVCPGNQMHKCEQDAIENLAKQFFKIATELNLAGPYGWTKYEDVYPKLGSTPMLGTNDVTTETYSLQDARDSMAIWTSGKKPIGIISNWSIGRDHPCNFEYVDTNCSSRGNQKESYEYAKIFAPYTSD